MDTSQYHANGMNPTNSPYSSLPGISMHQIQHNAGLPAHTLPPLQPQHPAMSNMYGSAPHTPRTPSAPNTPSAVNPMGSFPQMAQPSRQYQMMPANNYQQPPQAYRASSMMGPTTTMSHPQPIAPAPAHGRMPQALRPMPTGGLQHMQGGMPSPYGHQTQILSQASMEVEQPTHVVGSQGRRGILPSAPGRPAVTATGTGVTKNTMIPAKDADGKFPCPHCTKTYLHAKHLKRHLLRHTGDRPYMCVLCRDTFSRSDILKRHFQKCSIRRGNPTGASHLSHAQAHLKKSQPQGPLKNASAVTAENGLMGVNGMNGMNGMNGITNEAMHQNFGVIPDGSIPAATPNLTDEHATQEHISRSNSLKSLGNGAVRDPRAMTTSGPGGANFNQSYSNGIQSTMATAMNSQLAFSMPDGQNGHNYNPNHGFTAYSNGTNMQPQATNHVSNLQNGQPGMQNSFLGHSAGQAQGLDWSQMFQPGASENFMGPYNPNMANVQIKSEPQQQQQMPQQQQTYNPNMAAAAQMNIKHERSLTNTSNGLFTGVYPGNSNVLNQGADFFMWNLGSISTNEAFQQVSTQLYNFCFPSDAGVSSLAQEMRKILTADNVKHFLEHFANFQGHFPTIHTPTFRIMEAWEGLLLGMICIGAVYSDRVSPSQVREMVELTKVTIERNSPILAIVSREQNGETAVGTEAIRTGKLELEQIQALFMISVLCMWHGTPVQREKGRQQFPLLVTLAKRAGLTQPSTTAPFSVLHQPSMVLDNLNSANFDWNAWVEQEKRSRVLYGIYLVDTAMVIYFNMTPRFDILEVRLPLPADDAAWDARTPMQCADALGLNGPVAARDNNPEGSRRPKQPELHSALKALMHPIYDLQPGTTNLYSKFVLVHALHVQLWTVQKQLIQENGQINAQSMTFPNSRDSTPLGQNDWVSRNMDSTGSGVQSSNTSGRATPVEPGAQSPATQQLLKATNNAFDKWKKVWDEDIAVQYPPSSVSYRRFGFCRDGIHFYWLAKYLVKNYRPADWQMAPDHRFTQVMHLLKSVKSWVVSDSAQRGEELGSVNDINKDYGVGDLTLDMAKLFAPINRQTDSPVQGVQTNIGGNGMI